MATRLLIFTGEHRMVAVPPTKRLRAVLDEELRADEILNTVHTSEHSFAADSLPDNMLTGRKVWTASCSHATGLGEQVHTLQSEVQTLKTAVATLQNTQVADALVFGAQFVGNTAAQALLFASRDQPRVDPPSRRFRKMGKNDSQQLAAYLSAWPITPSTEAFCDAADAVINRRNHTLHYNSLFALEEDVKAALELLARHPSLRTKCRQESSVLDTFEELKAAFHLT